MFESPSGLVTEESTVARRSPVKEGHVSNRLAGVLTAGSAVIAGLAVIFQAKPVEATNGNLGSPCCNLATNRWCNYQVSHDRFTCSPGYNRTTWTCTEPGTGRLVFCGECSTGSSCYQGPWECSSWFYA